MYTYNDNASSGKQPNGDTPMPKQIPFRWICNQFDSHEMFALKLYKYNSRRDVDHGRNITARKSPECMAMPHIYMCVCVCDNKRQCVEHRTLFTGHIARSLLNWSHHTDNLRCTIVLNTMLNHIMRRIAVFAVSVVCPLFAGCNTCVCGDSQL